MEQPPKAPTLPRPDEFNDLPDQFARLLLVSGTGREHLLRLVRTGQRVMQDLLSAQREQVAAICRDALVCAWENAPFNGSLAQEVLNAHPHGLAPALRSLLESVTQNWQPPSNLSYFQRVLERRDDKKLKAYLASQRQKEPGNLFWAEQEAYFSRFSADAERINKLAHTLPEGVAPIAQSLQADAAYFAGEYTTAATLYNGCELQPSLLMRKSKALVTAGKPEKAMAALHQLLAMRPWQINSWLVLHDLQQGLSNATRMLNGKVAICLYTFNKADDINTTLRSLFESNLGSAKVIVLDNGSSDATPDVLTAWKQRAGENLSTLRLPVNVGAPPARNWLLTLDDVADSDFTAYLDDDADVPQDWLGRMGAAVDQAPDAGVWGCKVTDNGARHILQHVDQHLLPKDDGSEGFRVSDAHLKEPDFGWFDYMRPCSTVTGCCHVFRTRHLVEMDGFKPHFSPSQYDDMERDLRDLRNNRIVYYTGHLSVEHRKTTGKASHVNPVQEANAVANRHKLEAMHPAEVTDELMAACAKHCQDDISAKIAALDL